MYKVRFGGKKGQVLRLVESPAHLVMRTQGRERVGPWRSFGASSLRLESRVALSPFEQISTYPESGVEVVRLREGKRSRAIRDRARAVLKRDKTFEFAGRVVVERHSGRHFVYTENFFVQFEPDATKRERLKLLDKYRLKVKRPLKYAPGAYVVAAPDRTGLAVFEIAARLLAEPAVRLCHPELISDRRVRRAFDQQWHLKKTKIGGKVVNQHANVEAAWSLSKGADTIIAIIDDGVDVDHEEFQSPDKVIAARDVTRGTFDPRPRGPREDHGTACAGVACADGEFGASGVAPRARLMPIRFASGLGSQAEADAFVWAADNGADVISCSWGPDDGNFSWPEDPLHQHVEPLPDSTRLAIEYAVTRGRQGLGCVVLFAAGNGGESVDNDGYASNPHVIAVAACNDQGVRAPYSDFGKAVFCAFPSNHPFDSVTPGIWTTDRSSGLGYNPGDAGLGDAEGKYTNNFGGTSSACPGAAGVAALVIARNPGLTAMEVRDILRRCATRIDPQGGAYDAEGHSPFYGFGRLDARRAVELARP
jgi:subtilisin family serine protease